MADYIERKRLNEAILADCQHLSCFDESFFDMVMNDIDEVPAANVREDVQGEWVHDHTDMVGGNFAVVRCSVCGYKAYAIADHIRNGNFCPNCGARMAGGGKR